MNWIRRNRGLLSIVSIVGLFVGVSWLERMRSGVVRYERAIADWSSSGAVFEELDYAELWREWLATRSSETQPWSELDLSQLLVRLEEDRVATERGEFPCSSSGLLSSGTTLLRLIGDRCLDASDADRISTNETLVGLDLEDLLERGFRRLRLEHHAAFLEARRLGRDPHLSWMFEFGCISRSSRWQLWLEKRRSEIQEWLKPEFGLAEHARMLEVQAISLKVHQEFGLDRSKGLAFHSVPSIGLPGSSEARFADRKLEQWESLERQAFSVETTRRQLLCLLAKQIDGGRGWAAAHQEYTDPATGKPFRKEHRPGHGEWLISDWSPSPGQVLEMRIGF